VLVVFVSVVFTTDENRLESSCVVSFPARYNYFNVFLCFGRHVIFEFSGFGHEILSFAFSFFVYSFFKYFRV